LAVRSDWSRIKIPEALSEYPKKAISRLPGAFRPLTGAVNLTLQTADSSFPERDPQTLVNFAGDPSLVICTRLTPACARLNFQRIYLQQKK
jgi:hypothetical protein